MRVPLVAGNWKMHKTGPEAVALARTLVAAVPASPHREVVICPPFTALAAVAPLIEGSALRLGAQNLHAEPRGAYTGEISAKMLVAAGCSHVIVGHSERRRDFGESDELVARKCRAALAAALSPIVCVGETLAERDSGRANEIVARQVDAALGALSTEALPHLAVAYEPVWAIGTGVNATPEQAQEMHAFVRRRLEAQFGPAGAAVRILYGGSVNPENAAALLGRPDVDGALVGGASLESESFVPIVEAAR